MAAYACNSMLVLVMAAALASARTYKATITEYGTGDINNSGNCNVKSYVIRVPFMPAYLPIPTIPCQFPHTRIVHAVSTHPLASAQQFPRTCMVSVRVRVLDLLVADAGESPAKQ
jgi:hypothetical protein